MDCAWPVLMFRARFFISSRQLLVSGGRSGLKRQKDGAAMAQPDFEEVAMNWQRIIPN